MLLSIPAGSHEKYGLCSEFGGVRLGFLRPPGAEGGRRLRDTSQAFTFPFAPGRVLKPGNQI
jgi:hypothetical protein